MVNTGFVVLWVTQFSASDAFALKSRNAAFYSPRDRAARPQDAL